MAEIPILDVYGHGGLWLVWCEWCDRWHSHGVGGGHRVEHCLAEDSPYHVTGYILRWKGAATPSIIQALEHPRRLRMCRRCLVYLSRRAEICPRCGHRQEGRVRRAVSFA